MEQQTHTVSSLAARMADTSYIARQLGVHRNTVLNWKAGRTEPRLTEGLRLAKLLGVPSGILAGYFRATGGAA